MAQGQTQQPKHTKPEKADETQPKQAGKQAKQPPTETELDKQRADNEGMAPTPDQSVRKH